MRQYKTRPVWHRFSAQKGQLAARKWPKNDKIKLYAEMRPARRSPELHFLKGKAQPESFPVIRKDRADILSAINDKNL
ncbi:MAG: hypothetical protein QME28_10115 [Candidatus Saccharicenans sp.]|nr:hypothetical protein [Candidatus Saccharicenans sp.]